MKKLTNKFVAMATAVLGLAAVSANAQGIDPTFNDNDVLFGFRAASGAGSSTTIMINLGAATQYRSANFLNIANIGSILSTAYDDGATKWHERTNLWAGFVSASNGINVDNAPSGTTIANQTQDYNSTIYVSTRRTSTGTIGSAGSTRPGNVIALDAQTIGGQIQTLGLTFDANDSSGTYNGSSSVQNLWNTYMTGSSAADFSSYNVESSFTAGNRGSFGAAGTVEQMWDFYRVAQFPQSDPNAGKGLYQGTFTINSDGDISFTAIPEPSTYALLALAAAGLGAHVIRRRKRTA